jgi:hypothetical protein
MTTLNGRHLLFVLSGLYLCSCMPERRSLPTSTNAPAVRFVVHSLIGDATGRTDSVWSGNDDMDSVEIILEGMPPRVQASATIELELATRPGEPGADRPPSSVRTVQLKAMKLSSIDSLPRTNHGWLLFVVKPSTLHDSVEGHFGKEEVIEAVRVTVTPQSSKRIVAHLSLLFPI